MSSSFDLPEVTTFAAGTLGNPGNRTFFLQAVAGSQVISLRVEKQQVSLLADYLDRLLETMDIEDDPPAHMPDLVEPVLEEWVCGELMVAVNNETQQIVIVARELVEDDAEPAEARVALRGAQAEAFVQGAHRLVEAGRPLCPLCNMPMDPDGHPCPRLN